MMKKIIMTSLLTMLLGATSVLANGTDPKATDKHGMATESNGHKGVEVSGHVDVIAGYEHDDKNAIGTTTGGLNEVMGTASAKNKDDFRFVVNQVELDLAKTLGENIRLRADIDVNSMADSATAAGINLEQGYVTANLAAGNGVELLVGKFNAPVGLESVDRNDNALVSYSPNYQFLTPTNTTGAKIYYNFGDVDLHIAVVNSINAAGGYTNSDLPSFLACLGYTWGEEGRQSHVALNGGTGPERTVVGTDNKHWDFLTNLDGMFAVSDDFDLGLQGTWRMTEKSAAGTKARSAIAGQITGTYDVSDSWALAGRYALASDDQDGTHTGTSTLGTSWIGFRGMQHTASAGANYKIADGAKLKLEYRFDLAATHGSAKDPISHAGLAEFAYNF